VDNSNVVAKDVIELNYMHQNFYDRLDEAARISLEFWNALKSQTLNVD
jgi:hypothetical protein